LIENIRINKRHTNRQLTKGAIGCYLSHLFIYNIIIKNNIQFALIFEDDCNIPDSNDDFWKKMNIIKIPDDTDIFLFDAYIHEYDIEKYPNNFSNKVLFFYGVYFYLITLQGAYKFLKYALPIKYQIDNFMSMLSYTKKINI